MKFFDFCSGIGTARIALESLGMTCVGHSEIDPKPDLTYRKFFGDACKNWGDLMAIQPGDLPDFDLMVAGFPCQTFSIAGKRAGMRDDRGLIIQGLCNILKTKQPSFCLLENVKGLISHDNGRTLKEVVRLLNESGYQVKHQVLKSTDFGIPQIRERIFLLCSRKELNHPLTFTEAHQPTRPLCDFLIEESDSHLYNCDFDSNPGQTLTRYLSNKYNRSEHSLDTLLSEHHLVIDTRQSDLRLYRDVIPTLRTGRHGILYVRNGQLRKLSGYEALLLQGIPKNIAQKAHSIPTTNLLSQAGNAMTVNVVKALAKQLTKQNR